MTQPNGPRTGRPPTRASRGMVATSHYLASTAGQNALSRGGSAVDAAIAANAVLCVAYPHMAGLGGDGFWLIAGSDINGVQALDACGPAASAATRERYRQFGFDQAIPSRGPHAALTVPGAVDGWRKAHERHGKLAWSELFDDAIDYAHSGVPVSRSLADLLAQDAPLLRNQAAAERIFLADGQPSREGERLVQSELARSFETLASEGARGGFYEGRLAQAICDGLADAGCPLSTNDFAAYQAEWVDPISTTYRDHEVFEMPPPTQGLSTLQILNLLESFDVAAWGDGSVDYYHHIVEAVKVAFADRDEWLTDPRYVDIPLEELLSKEYATTRRALIDRERAMISDQVEPGLHFGPQAQRAAPGGDTVYFSAADDDGLVVSCIQSIYHDFGAGVVGGDTGIVLQNRGSFFSLNESHPNRLEPGKRSFHTIIPAMALRGGKPVLAFGSMGGEGQPQTQTAILTRLIDFGYDVQQAIEAPRWLMGRTWGTESRDLWLESTIADNVARELKLRGQPVQRVGALNNKMGHAQAIAVDSSSGFYEGGADPRGDGAAIGY